MTSTNALERIETDNNEKAMALNNLLAKEYKLFVTMMNFRFLKKENQHCELDEFFEVQYQNFFHVFETITKLIKNENSAPLMMVSVLESEPSPKENTNTVLIEMLRVAHELQASIKHMIAVQAFFHAQPATEEFMVGIVENHEEMCAVIERNL